MKYEVDTRDKELNKAIVAEDPEEDYEADNYEEDADFIKDDNRADSDREKTQERILTRVNNNEKLQASGNKEAASASDSEEERDQVPT